MQTPCSKISWTWRRPYKLWGLYKYTTRIVKVALFILLSAIFSCPVLSIVCPLSLIGWNDHSHFVAFLVLHVRWPPTQLCEKVGGYLMLRRSLWMNQETVTQSCRCVKLKICTFWSKPQSFAKVPKCKRIAALALYTIVDKLKIASPKSSEVS